MTAFCEEMEALLHILTQDSRSLDEMQNEDRQNEASIGHQRQHSIPLSVTHQGTPPNRAVTAPGFPRRISESDIVAQEGKSYSCSAT